MVNTSFLATFGAVSGVFALGACGFLARRRAVITHQGLSELSRLLVDFLLPATLFNSMYSQFDPRRLDQVLQPAFAQVILLITGTLAMASYARLARLRSPRGTVIALASFQNNVYLPLPIAIALLPHQDAVRAQFYIGCFVLFFTPTLWSVGVLLLSDRAHRHRQISRWRLVLNPPFVAALSGLTVKLILDAVGGTMPSPVANFLTLMGNGTVPIAMIVLGALIAEVGSVREVETKAIYGIALIKMFLLPLGAFVFLYFWRGGDPVFRVVLMLEAAAPPATNISLIVRRFGGETALVASTTFITYLLSALSIPLWLTLYSLLN
ncbi:MAG: AEC family transporter [Candidatus Sumerlaeaceae bacterium]|jgi:predicted permease